MGTPPQERSELLSGIELGEHLVKHGIVHAVASLLTPYGLVHLKPVLRRQLTDKPEALVRNPAFGLAAILTPNIPHQEWRNRLTIRKIPPKATNHLARSSAVTRKNLVTYLLKRGINANVHLYCSRFSHDTLHELYVYSSL